MPGSTSAKSAENQQVDPDDPAQAQDRLSQYEEKSDEARRASSSDSLGSSSGSSSSVDYDPQFRSLQSRNTEVDLERQRTNASQALSRIETQRLQHSMTVGESISSRPSKLPLPPFGGGKPYPPQLPHRDDFVVEFDGPDDPLYPQNWPLNKKYVTHLLLYVLSLTMVGSTRASFWHLPVSALPLTRRFSAHRHQMLLLISALASRLLCYPAPCTSLVMPLVPWSGLLFPSSMAVVPPSSSVCLDLPSSTRQWLLPKISRP